MCAKKQIELKLLDEYWNEAREFMYTGRDAVEEGKKSHELFLKEFRRKIDIYEKQILNCKIMFLNDKNFQEYEAGLHYLRSVLKWRTGMHYEYFPGRFTSPSNEYLSAVDLCNQALQLHENIDSRWMKVICYRTLDNFLGTNKDALLELEQILELYADDDDVYLEARRQKDEIESLASSGVGGFFRSLFGTNS